jgi:hypothetical protein
MFVLALGLALAAQRLAPAGLAGVAVKLGAVALDAALVWGFGLWRHPAAPVEHGAPVAGG